MTKAYDLLLDERGKQCIVIPLEQVEALLEMRDEYSEHLTREGQNLHGKEKREYLDPSIGDPRWVDSNFEYLDPSIGEQLEEIISICDTALEIAIPNGTERRRLLQQVKNGRKPNGLRKNTTKI